MASPELRHCDDDDGLDDLSEERPLPPPVDARNARPAPLCECEEPLFDDGGCSRCGHDLPEAMPEAA
jgi:hypothetical protein